MWDINCHDSWDKSIHFVHTTHSWCTKALRIYSQDSFTTCCPSSKSVPVAPIFSEYMTIQMLFYPGNCVDGRWMRMCRDGEWEEWVWELVAIYLQIYFVVEFSSINYPQCSSKYAVQIAEEINHKSGWICNESDSPIVQWKFTCLRCLKYLLKLIIKHVELIRFSPV